MKGECLFEKFFLIARGALEHSEEIGLSEDTFRKLKELKIKTKKELIRDRAEMEILAVDIMAKLWEPKPDIAEINKILDKKFDLKKDSAKRFLAAFVALRGLITMDQLRKLKGLCKGEGGGHEGGEGQCCR